MLVYSYKKTAICSTEIIIEQKTTTYDCNSATLSIWKFFKELASGGRVPWATFNCAMVNLISEAFSGCWSANSYRAKRKKKELKSDFVCFKIGTLLWVTMT